MSVIKMRDLNIAGKRVLIRADLNVPIKDNQVTSDARIRAALPTLRWALQQGAYVMVTSHLGRPTEGEYHEQFSLLPVARHLQTLIDAPVRLVRHYLEGLPIAAGELVILENVRFNRGEKHNDLQLAQRYAALCDLFVMDAFGTAHRAQASTHGVAQLAPMACAGPLLCAELTALNQALLNPARPLVAVVAGSKVSTKLPLLNALAQKVNQLIVGGGICNTFIAAQGYSVGRSLYEADLIPQAKQLLATTTIPMPSNVQVATCFSEQAIATLKHVSRVAEEDYILDLGEQSAQHLSILLKQAKTIIWNGPVGVFEFPQFARGTEIIARAIAESDAFSIAGGGDTLAVIDHFGIADKISYISTGGGAFLEFLQGTTLPAVEVLEQRAQGALLKQGQ